MKLIKGDYVKNGERARDGETQPGADEAAADESAEAEDTGKIINIQEDDGNDRS